VAARIIAEIMFELAVKKIRCASDEAFKSGEDAPIFVPDG